MLTKAEKNRINGRKGGNATKAKMLKDNPYFYSEIGTKGGNEVKNTLGVKHYRKIGKIKPNKEKKV